MLIVSSRSALTKPVEGSHSVPWTNYTCSCWLRQWKIFQDQMLGCYVESDILKTKCSRLLRALLSSRRQPSMEFYLTVLALLLSFGLVFSWLTQKPRGAPPGPFSWPLVGCLFSVRKPFHRYLASLSEKYGPVMYLRIGTVPYVVVNSPEMAREVLKVHDAEFCHRSEDTFMGREYSFNYSDIVFSNGSSMEELKKFARVHYLNPKILTQSAADREAEALSLVKSICKQLDCGDGKVVDLRKLVGECSSRLLCSSLFGPDILPGDRFGSLVEHGEAICKLFKSVNVGELIPSLEWLDLHGVNRVLSQELMPKLKAFIEQVLDEHKDRKAKMEAENEEFVCRDLMDVLLTKGQHFSNTTVVALMHNLLLGGMQSSMTTTEWAMAEVISNPRVMRTAKEEIYKVVGKKRWVGDSDLPNLPYIRAVLKETLRLHPAGPLAIPHFNPKDSSIAGYRIPAKCRVIVNLWAVGQDSKHWKDPEKFQPERFILSEVSFTGQHFEFIPFSSGTRICPGYPMVMRTVPLVVATLLQAFDWSLPDGVERINLEETPDSVELSMMDRLVGAASLSLDKSMYVQ